MRGGALELRGELRAVVACHCRQCLISSGHVAAATAVARTGFTLLAGDGPGGGLRWYRSSPRARRGFCGTCGSSLFWDADGSPIISVFAGTIDPPTGLEMALHIFTEHPGDYYRIADGLPALPRGMDSP